MGKREKRKRERERERENRRKRERGREREKRKKERNISVRKTFTSSLPYVPRLGIKPATFCCTGRHSNQLSNLARALPLSFKNKV